MTTETRGQAGDEELVAPFRMDAEEFDRYFREVHLYAAGRLDVQAGDDIAAETFRLAFSVTAYGSPPGEGAGRARSGRA
ncbi:hypothetical protein ACIBP6_44130 [Nonomuraea terrae]|uniref:hypothetical protein n=1 Tax=Nonomuraea terrae TaxID=2530383 RepID=UPI0037B7562F